MCPADIWRRTAPGAWAQALWARHGAGAPPCRKILLTRARAARQGALGPAPHSAPSSLDPAAPRTTCVAAPPEAGGSAASSAAASPAKPAAAPARAGAQEAAAGGGQAPPVPGRPPTGPPLGGAPGARQA